MPSVQQTTAWAARRAVAASADGAAWDRLTAAFAADWKAAYSAAFLAFAATRGWKREDAKSWASEIADDALQSADEHGYDPVKTAQHDVIECELECE